MNIKNNKGITLIAMILTVILLIIIAGVSVSVGTNIIETTKFKALETDLLLIQSKIKKAANEKAIGEITEEELYGTKQESGEYEDWYLLSQTDLNKMGLKDLDAEDNYYVDYENDDVAFGIGFEYRETTYYKLSDIKASNN